MAEIFGIDFGTTNSLVSLVLNGKLERFTQPASGLPHPSAVWFSGEEVVTGSEAKDMLRQGMEGVSGEGIRSPKAELVREAIYLEGQQRSTVEVVGEVFKHLVRETFAVHPEIPMSVAVVTIPVAMNGEARGRLREAALTAGVSIKQFVHEPLAALYGHLRSRRDFQEYAQAIEGRPMLVVDWGGGTLDLTLCKLVGDTLTQIRNDGDNTVGGDHFDEAIIDYVKRRHREQYDISEDHFNPSSAALGRLLELCEMAKIELSKDEKVTVFMRDFLPQASRGRDLEVVLSREHLVGEICGSLITRGISRVRGLLKDADCNPHSVYLCLGTGGIVQMPAVRRALVDLFDPSRVPQLENSLTSISEGAAWIAHDNLNIALAKPFDVLQADNNFVTLIRPGELLPQIDHPFQSIKKRVYCVDPIHGWADLMFCRPLTPGDESPLDPRKFYKTLTLKVRPDYGPLTEPIELRLEIDRNLILTATAHSSCDQQEVHILDLEFGLELPWLTATRKTTYARRPEAFRAPTSSLGSITAQPPGSIRLRSNVSLSRDDRLVPRYVWTQLKEMRRQAWEEGR